MKKIILIFALFFPFLGFGQTELGEYGNMDTTKIEGESIIFPGDSTGQYYYTKGRDPSEPLDLVNLRTLFQRIAMLDSLGLLVSDIVSGTEIVNTGEKQIYFQSAFDSNEVTVVPLVRRISDDAVIDFVINDVDSLGFDVVVWEDNIRVSYVASQNNSITNDFFNNILLKSDTLTIVIDTTQVRNLQEFVENHSTGGTTVLPSIKITYTGIPQTPLLLPLSMNAMTVVSVDSVTGQATYTGESGVCLDNFYYTENSLTTGDLLTSFSFDDLFACNGNFVFTGLSACTNFYAPKLKYVLGGITIGLMASCVSVNLDSLVSFGLIGSSNTFSGMPNLSLLEFPELTEIKGTFQVANNPNLTSIKFPKIIRNKSSDSRYYTGNGNIVYFEYGNIGTLKYLTVGFDVSGQKLSQGSVDSTLTLLASLDGTNGTTLFGTFKTVNLSGGTSATPTFTGTTTTPAGSSFVGSTTTCTATIVGHGFSTGDLLTISGITTLTNANGTFSITKDTDNQFHYTIASQTATGAGTATVKKAGSTTEGYYYKQLLQVRGATVTTN
jgi:hypothetical protein